MKTLRMYAIEAFGSYGWQPMAIALSKAVASETRRELIRDNIVSDSGSRVKIYHVKSQGTVSSLPLLLANGLRARFDKA